MNKEEVLKWFEEKKPQILTASRISKSEGVTKYEARKRIKVLVEEGLIKYGYCHLNYCDCITDNRNFHECESKPPVWGYFRPTDKSITFKP